MKLENLLSKAKKTIAGTAIGLAAAFSPIYGCGEDHCTKIEKIDTVSGLYQGTFEVTDDPQDMVPETDETGEINVPIYPLDADENYLNIGIFEWHPYELGSDGYVEDAWTSAYGETLHVHGTVLDGKLNLNASVDGLDFWTNKEYFINWKIEGLKQTEYNPEE